MKFLFKIGLVVTVSVFLFSGMMFADEPGQDAQTGVKLLREAAAALKPYDVELANKVNIYADMEQEELLGREGSIGEAAMLKTAARELKASNPELSQRLDAFADKEIKEQAENDQE
jgi:hypothetical protein